MGFVAGLLVGTVLSGIRLGTFAWWPFNWEYVLFENGRFAGRWVNRTPEPPKET